MRTTNMDDLLKDAPDQSVICFTTNGVVKNNGKLVMGAGIAKQVNEQFYFADIDKHLGSVIKSTGNIPIDCGAFDFGSKRCRLVSFPTKHDFKDKSDIDLIKQSAEKLVALANSGGWKEVYLPAPGCGLGGLRWADVKPVLESILDNRFTIVFKNKTKQPILNYQSQPSVDPVITAPSKFPIYEPQHIGPKGFLQLTYLSNLKNIDLTQFKDKRKLFIVRAPGKVDISKLGLTLVPQLAPSVKLLDDTQRWKKNQFTNIEIIKIKQGKTGTWWDLYVPRFIQEMKERADFQACIRRTMELLDHGENILMLCFCKDFNMCHRSIIGYFIEQKGYSVKYN